MLAAWITKHDPLFGSFRERVLGQTRGICFACGEDVNGQAYERERGGAHWLVHFPECPKRAKGGGR